jgi:hypothetical protein
MNMINKPTVKDRYDESDFEMLGFHDCHIWAIKWNRVGYDIVFDIDYIVKWIEPTKDNKTFRFWICPAELRFVNADDVNITLCWKDMPLRCCIEDLYRGESRTTPNGTIQLRWQLELSEPVGNISFWATGFELKMLATPELSDMQYLNKKGH